MIITFILLVLYIYIRPTKLLENSAFNTKFGTDRRLYTKPIGLDYNNNTKIKEAISIDKNNNNEKKRFLENK